MTIKRAILITLTVLAAWLIGADLLASWNQPQIQSRLELYQTNLLLQASTAQGAESQATRRALLGTDPVKNALEQYQEVRQSVQQNFQRTKQLLQAPSAAPASLQATAEKLQRSLTELDLNLGILQTQQQKPEAAQQLWAQVMAAGQAQSPANPANPPRDRPSETAQVLAGLWSEPAQILPDAELILKSDLTGWFRYRALARLYDRQERPTERAALQATEQQAATQALGKLAIVGGLPVIGCILGVGTLLFLLGQWALRRPQSILSPAGLPTWTTPWDGEVVWQVLIIGFFLVGQILIPLALSLLRDVAGFNPGSLGERGRSLYILANYIALATGGLSVLYFSIKPFFPLPDGWFRASLRGWWWLWGLAGYFTALPLVILVSLVNQKIWQGQGGSNPILPIALDGKDNLALAMFVITAAVAAPLFEEILFRGFLLPSLTRYMPTWGAIALSSFIFAIAHLSLSEVLPLMTLGMILGFVYARSRNLLASMLLHGLWNSGTLFSLFVLGGSS
jgi:uncharacterized protein